MTRTFLASALVACALAACGDEAIPSDAGGVVDAIALARAAHDGRREVSGEERLTLARARCTLCA